MPCSVVRSGAHALYVCMPKLYGREYAVISGKATFRLILAPMRILMYGSITGVKTICPGMSVASDQWMDVVPCLLHVGLHD